VSHERISVIYELSDAEKIELVLVCTEYAFGSECRQYDDFSVTQIMGHGYCISSKYGIICLYGMNEYRIVMYREANKLRQQEADIPESVVKSTLRRFKISKL
jgi:hypothetical protein